MTMADLSHHRSIMAVPARCGREALAHSSVPDKYDDMSSAAIVEQIWREQSQWSQVADEMRRRIERSRLAGLVLVVAVAILGTASASTTSFQPTVARVLAAVAAFGAAMTVILRSRWSGAAVRDWTRARSVSESLKSDVFRWLATGGDAGDNAGNTTDSRLLREKLNTMHADTVDLLERVQAVAVSQRSLPAVSDAASYFAERVTGQIDSYYRRRAAELKKRLDRFDGIGTVLAVVGALLGAAAALFGTGVAAWIAVVTTIATAVSAHVAATRYRFQHLEFRRTAERLSQLRDQAAETDSASEHGALIQAAEDAITGENRGWMAKLVKEDP